MRTPILMCLPTLTVLLLQGCGGDTDDARTLNAAERAVVERFEGRCEAMCDAIAAACEGGTAECEIECQEELTDLAEKPACEASLDTVLGCCADADYTAVCADRDVDVKRCFYGPCEAEFGAYSTCKHGGAE